jgi:hypothetical protein
MAGISDAFYRKRLAGRPGGRQTNPEPAFACWQAQAKAVEKI